VVVASRLTSRATSRPQLVAWFGLRLPTGSAPLSRTLVTLEDTLTSIDRDFSLVDSAMLRLPRLRRVPERLDELLGQAIAGRLSARVSIFSDRRYERFVTWLVDRLVLAMIATASSVLALRVVAGVVRDGQE